MRLVLDTNVLVAAQRSHAGASARLIDAARAGKFTMLVSAPLFFEYEAVLTREEHLAAGGVERELVNRALDALATLVEPVDIRFLWRPRASDPDDDMVLEAAINGRAEAIVSFDAGAFAAAPTFGIIIMTPAVAWAKLRG